MNKEIEKLNKKIKERDNEIDKRIRKALNKLEKNLNQNCQQDMILLNNILIDNWQIDSDLIMKELEKKGYLENFEIINDNRIIICKEPYSELFFGIVGDMKMLSFNIIQEILVSEEVEEFIHKFCEEKMKGGN